MMKLTIRMLGPYLNDRIVSDYSTSDLAAFCAQNDPNGDWKQRDLSAEEFRDYLIDVITQWSYDL